jgi:hypothetical protein
MLLALGLLTYSAVPLAAEIIPASTAYDANPKHLWNELNSALFARVAPDGTVYGLDELDILYWSGTEHLLTEPSHSAAIQVLDRFIQVHGERLLRDPFKRALLQRDLWELFDWAAMPGKSDHPAQRAELEERLAMVIRRMALSEGEIAGLADNYASAAPNPDLPRGLFTPDGEWITARSNDATLGFLASRHTEGFNGHSVFLVMVRLPQGRTQTVDYLNSLRDFDGPLVYARRQTDGTRRLMINPDVPQFPAGTEWALVRRLCVIDREGHIRPTSLIESIRLRRYDSIEPLRLHDGGSGAASDRPAQQMFEFDMDRMHGGALRALAPGELDFQFVHFMSQGGDPFELPFSSVDRTPNPAAARHATLSTCHQCHALPGIRSVASFNRENVSTQTVQRLQATTELPPEMARSYTPPPNAQQETESTVQWKYRQFDWGVLQGLWRRPATWGHVKRSIVRLAPD